MPKYKKGNSFSIHNNTKESIPNLPFEKIKNRIVGKNYSLSLVFVGNKLSRILNRKYRGMDKPTDILSFPLEKNEGEVFINLKEVRRKAPVFRKSFKNYLGFVLIHGLLHLKGLEHGSKMEDEEKRFSRIFSL